MTEAPQAARTVRSRPQWRAFLELGFRPLYLAGCLWAAVSVALWVGAPHWLTGTLAGVAWHAHEMLWGFVATIAAGFLLTASANWTGINPLQGRALGMLCALWLLARLGFLAPGETWFRIAAASELAFFVWAALALARVIHAARSRRNYGVPLLLLALGIADALYLAAVLTGGDHAVLMQRFTLGLLCMALIALLVARRVIPFFAMRAVPGLDIPMHTRSGHWQLGAAALAAAFGLFRLDAAMACALMVAGAIAWKQVLDWKPRAVLRQPLLWILYLGYAGLGTGLVIAAACAAGWLARSAWPVHVIGMAGFSMLIIGMVTRTALGHLGRPLKADRAMVASYLLLAAAVALRLLALAPTPFAIMALHASAAAWVLAFTLYLWRFVPMMIRPKARS